MNDKKDEKMDLRQPPARVKVKFYAYLRDVFGAKEKEITFEPGTSLYQLLKSLAVTAQQKKEIFKDARINPGLVVMLNGSVVNPEGISEIKLEDGATIAIFPMMGGG